VDDEGDDDETQHRHSADLRWVPAVLGTHATILSLGDTQMKRPQRWVSRKTAAYEALVICRLLYPWRAILTPRKEKRP